MARVAMSTWSARVTGVPLAGARPDGARGLAYGGLDHPSAVCDTSGSCAVPSD